MEATQAVPGLELLGLIALSGLALWIAAWIVEGF